MKISICPAGNYLLACLSVLLATACQTPYQRDEGMVWNTSYHITYQAPHKMTDSILKVLDEVDKSLSVFNPQSLVSKVNSSMSQETDSLFRTVYLESVMFNRESDGMFDPTVSPLVTAWGFGPGHKISADTVAIDSILSFTGINKTSLHGNVLVKDDPRIQFNFSAIAKGFGCDMIADMLRRNGIDNYLVEIGGELAVGGKSPRGGKWNISIDRPILTESREIHDSNGVIEVTGCGIATSGNYRNFHKEKGKTFGHTISPLTGRPIATDVISATIVAPSCMKADGAATACMAVGAEKARNLIERLGYEGMLILSDSSIWTSRGFILSE